MSASSEQELPASTAELLPFLEQLYPASAVSDLLVAGKTNEALKEAGKIELINELIQLHRDQSEARRANEAGAGS